MFISIMDDYAGFYSLLFFSVNHYLYCKKNDISFQLDTNIWMFKTKNGWTDYFKNIDFKGTNEENETKIVRHSDLLGDFPIHEYKEILLNEFYLYNDLTKEKINEAKIKYGLTEKGSYDSIFIRRGDKLCYESDFFPTEKYVDLLLEKNPDCRIIFLQTDDYNCFLDIQKYILDKNLDIKVITLCNPETTGMVIKKDVFQRYTDKHHRQDNDVHNNYYSKVLKNLSQIKPVEEMNSEEIYQHTMDMIIGVDIVLHSNYCILDNQSNVSRFICITHDSNEKVFDIRFPNENYDMNRTNCPAYN